MSALTDLVDAVRDIDTIRSRLAELQSQATSLQSKLQRMQDEAAALQTQLAAAKQRAKTAAAALT